MYDLFFKTIHKALLVLVVYWLCSVLSQLFHLSVGLGVASLFVAVWLFLAPSRRESFYTFLVKQKWLLAALAVLFQIAVILSANLLVRRDAGVVINGAFGLIADQSISNYLSRNPNNLFFFLYERSLYNLFGDKAIWILQTLGLIYMNATGYLLYRTAKNYLSQKSADTVLILYLLLLGFSPYVIQTYTDVTSLPLLALQVLLIFSCLLPEKSAFGRMIGLGSVTALAVSLRPTAIIVIISFFMLSVLSQSWKKWLPYLFVFALSFGVVYGGIESLLSKQNQVVIRKEEALAKSWLTFINLGLTFSGTDQEDMKEGLLRYIPEAEWDNYNNGLFAKEHEIKEIKRRLAEYTPLTFLHHLHYKLYYTLYDGSLNWLYTNPEKEKSAFVSPLYPYTASNRLAKWMRQTIIQKDGSNYTYYKMIKQVVWLWMVMGLLVALWFYRPDARIQFLTLSIFGGLLFLLIFEGGKTRYLLQFFPQILLLASYGWNRDSKKENTCFQ